MPLTALNYTTHAIEDLTAPLVNLKRNGFPRSARNLESLTKLMGEAVKFILPEHGELIALETLDEAFSEFIKLPFDAVCLEAPYSPAAHTTPVYDKDDNFKEHPSTRRISVAWTQVMRDRYPALCPFEERVGFYVASVYYDDLDKLWVACPLLNFIPNNPKMERLAELPHAGYQEKEYSFLLERGAVRASSTSYECHTEVLLPELIEAMAHEMDSVEDAVVRFSLDMRDETATTLGFCLTVNASNVGKQRIEPPAKLNKKRFSSGRVPFFESWVLDLTKRPVGARADSELEPGLRESPRLHLRRGHIRRLGADRIAYVRATSVGSLHQGEISKTYRLGR